MERSFGLRFCSRPGGPFFFLRKSQNTISTHPNGAETSSVSILVCRLKNAVFYPPGISNTPTLTSSKAHSKSPYSVYNRGPHGEANAQRSCLLVGQVPLYSCAVESVLRESCLVTRSPSCARFIRQTATSVVLFFHVECLVGRTMASSQLQAAPTPRRMRWQQKTKGPNK